MMVVSSSLLISILISVLVFCLIIWCVRLVLNMLAPPEPIPTVVQVILCVIFLVWLLRVAGFVAL